ncbi:thioredoxin family protein [Pseudomonas sp. NPDC087346]|uniref:thioredoxin family protein n=1 Tax=Pseudomonas sp. NPDC087346 TaxID=3364438 RepID=UPI0038253D16
MSDPVTTFNDSNFESEVLKSAVPTMVLFSATWSGPCKYIVPVFDGIAVTYAGRARFSKVDVDESPITAKSLAINNVPAIRLFKSGKVVVTLGAVDKAQLTAALDANV